MLILSLGQAKMSASAIGKGDDDEKEEDEDGGDDDDDVDEEEEKVFQWRKIKEKVLQWRKIKEQEKVFMDDLSEDGFSSLEGDYEDDW